MWGAERGAVVILTDGVCLEGVAIGSEPRVLPALPTLRWVRLCDACWECGSALASTVLSLALPDYARSDVIAACKLGSSEAAGADQGGSAAGTTGVVRRGCGGIARGLAVDAGYALFQLTDTIVCLVQCGGIRTRAAWRARMKAAGVGTIMLLALVTRTLTIAADLRGDVASRAEGRRMVSLHVPQGLGGRKVIDEAQDVPCGDGKSRKRSRRPAGGGG